MVPSTANLPFVIDDFVRTSFDLPSAARSRTSSGETEVVAVVLDLHDPCVLRLGPRELLAHLDLRARDGTVKRVCFPDEL